MSLTLELKSPQKMACVLLFITAKKCMTIDLSKLESRCDNECKMNILWCMRERERERERKGGERERERERERVNAIFSATSIIAL